jgi:hypothetical protein
MGYGVSARAYLERAKERLLEDSKESLFYAAFELRCSVEARQSEYIDAMKNYARMKKTRSWEVNKSQKELERVFRGRTKIVRIQIMGEKDDLIHESYYTPVQRKLARNTGRLGIYLHVMDRYRDEDDEWWDKTRSELLQFYRQVWISCRGNMLASTSYGSVGKGVLSSDRSYRR